LLGDVFAAPGAEQDLADAPEFYIEHASLLVARRFHDEILRVAELLTLNWLGHTDHPGRRVFPLRIFPYSVVYRRLEASIRIIIVRHQHRKPGYGSTRQ
jgi:plasmid stabilization system protein ParE